MMKIKKGDTVKVIAGSSKGKEAKVISVDVEKNKVVVEGVNMVKKHQKARSQTAPSGIVEREGSIDASNVMLVDGGKATRVGFKVTTDDNGKVVKKERFAKKTGNVIK